MNDDIRKYQAKVKNELLDEIGSVKIDVEKTLMKDIEDIPEDYKLNIKIFDKTFLPLFGGGITDADERDRYIAHWVSFVKLPYREVELVNDDGETILKVPSLFDQVNVTIPSVDESMRYSSNNILTEAILKYQNSVESGPVQAREEVDNDMVNIINNMTVENTDRKKHIDKLVMRYKMLQSGKLSDDKVTATVVEEDYDDDLLSFD